MNHEYFIISWMYECYSDVADFLCVRIVLYGVSCHPYFIVAILFCD